MLHGAKRGYRIAGTYVRKQTASYGTASSFLGTTLTLSKDGHFDSTLATHFATGSSVGRPDDQSTVSASGGTAGGTWNVGTNQQGVSGQSQAQDQGEHAGTYLIDGFVIELRYGNGRVERKSFAVADNNDWIVIGGLMMPSKD